MGYIHVCTYIYINNYYESTEEKKSTGHTDNALK